MAEEMSNIIADLSGGKVEVAQPEAPTLDVLKAQMRAAIDEGNDPEVVKLGKQIVKFKSDIEKGEADRLKVEAEAMAGDREKLAIKIHKAVKSVVTTDELEAVKAKGFTFNLNTDELTYKSVALLVPTIKTRSGGGGGGTGNLKRETGLSRHELIDQYATEAEKQEIAKAETDATSRPDSARYTAEKPVIKRILADNQHLIKR